MWHDALSPGDVRALRSNLQELAKTGITIGTACSGTDIIVLVLEALSQFWASEYGVQVPLRQAFACESQESVQAFLCQQFPSCEVVFQDVADLAKDHAPACALQAHRLSRVSRVSLFSAGFVCKSRSKFNMHCSANLGCVQSGEDLTGQSWQHVSAYIKHHRPLCVLLECVSDLDQQVPETGISDTQFIVRWLEDNNYGAAAFKVEATAHGSVARRERTFWVAFAGNREGLDTRLTSIPRLLACMRIGPVEGIDAYLLPATCHQLRAKTPKEASERDFKYKDDHARLYDLVGAQWPPARGAFGGGLDHLPARAYEVAFLCDFMFPYPMESSPIQYVDVNKSMVRLVGANGETNPWSDTLPTLTGNGMYLMRRAGKPSAPAESPPPLCHEVEIRQLDGMELFQVIGFHLLYIVSSFPDHDLATRMSGNAFSGFAVGAILVGICSAFGAEPRSDSSAAAIFDD